MVNLITTSRKTNELLKSFKDDIERSIGDWFGTNVSDQDRRFLPKIDVSESNDKITVKAELPGLKPEDIDLSIDHNLLTIKGSKKDAREEKDKNFYVMECSYGSFARTISLPIAIDENKVDAQFENGELTINIPKAQTGEGTKKIPINKT